MSRSHFAPTALTLAALAAAASSALGAGTTLFQDDFSYATQSDMLSAYSGPGSTGSAGTLSALFDLGVPSPDGGNTTQALRYHDMPAAGTGVPEADHVFNPTGITPSDATPIVWSYDYYWDGSGNKRVASGLRMVNGATTSDILEMGYYNSAYNPITQAAGSGFAVRTVLVPGSGGLPESASLSGWRLLTNSDGSALLAGSATAGSWMTFKAVIKSHEIDYSVDLNRDGTIDSTYVAKIADPNATQLDLTAAAFTDVRFGGPSGLSSAGGGAFFDNLSIVTAPTKLPGDVNGDGFVNSGDINAFIFALSHDAAGFATQYPTGNYNNADVNGDSHAGDTFVNASDINPFIAILSGTGEPGITAALAAVPEPASLSLLALGATTLLARRRGRA